MNNSISEKIKLSRAFLKAENLTKSKQEIKKIIKDVKENPEKHQEVIEEIWKITNEIIQLHTISIAFKKKPKETRRLLEELKETANEVEEVNVELSSIIE